MKKLNPLLAILCIIALLFNSCKNSKVVQSEAVTITPVKKEYQEPPFYHSSRKKTIDILHTKLQLSFNWDSSFVNGEADLRIKPYFYDLDTIRLDARGFEILKLGKKNKNEIVELKYTYENEVISIPLDKKLSNRDSVEIYIKYIAKPNKLKVNGSAAIAADKGLYFINPDGSDKNKPRQLWTQGETQANSCWFPTVDSPNEKFTQEIYLTIEEGQTSISNGLK
ncbi:MAG TPA: hypothetical protein VIY47_12670, partial [Ignavibacteriaceae bacterium]